MTRMEKQKKLLHLQMDAKKKINEFLDKKNKIREIYCDQKGGFLFTYKPAYIFIQS